MRVDLSLRRWKTRLSPAPFSIVALALFGGGISARAEPQRSPDQAQIRAWIADLGAEDFFARDLAQHELSRLGESAFDDLHEAEQSDDSEIAARASYLVRRIRVQWQSAEDEPEIRTLLRNFGWKSAKARAATVKQIARLPGMSLAPLCRLTAFDRDEATSKLAAIAIFELDADHAIAEARPIGEVITESLAKSRRVAAHWTRRWLEVRAEPKSLSEMYLEFALDEERLLHADAGATSPEIVAKLWRLRAGALHGQGLVAETREALSRMIAVMDGSADQFVDTLEWLARRQWWEQVDEIEKRFQEEMAGNVILLYALARVRKSQGNVEAEKKTVERALALAGDNLPWHVAAMQELVRRGNAYGVEHESRKLIALAPASNRFGLYAHSRLAEIRHDQGDDLEAARLLTEARDAIARTPDDGQGGMADMIVSIRSRACYLRACAAAAAGDRDRELKELREGLKADEHDIELLIALFRREDLSPEDKQRVSRGIEEAAEMERNRIKESPDEALSYNQLAWLIGNTVGDFEEAVRSSRKSLALSQESPEGWANTAGYLDTLARCTYAAGDVRKAIIYQKGALRIDPYSGQMRRQLEFFEKQASQTK